SLTMAGGALNISRALNNTGTGTFNMTGGTLTVAKYTAALSSASPTALSCGASSNTTINGTVQVQRGNISAGGDIVIATTSGTASFTGSTLQIGNSNTAVSQTIKLSSAYPLYDVTINSTNSPVLQLASNLTVNHNLTVNTGTT